MFSKKKQIGKLILQLSADNYKLDIWIETTKLLLEQLYGKDHNIIIGFTNIKKKPRKLDFGVTQRQYTENENEKIIKSEYKQFLESIIDNEIKSNKIKEYLILILGAYKYTKDFIK